MTLSLSSAALLNVAETGIAPEADIDAIVDGEMTRDALLARCLDGADADRVQGWHEYVAAVAAEAARDIATCDAARARARAAEAHAATLVPGVEVTWDQRGTTLHGTVEGDDAGSALRRRVREGGLTWLVETQFLAVVV